MKHFLRFSFLVLFAMVSSFSIAQTTVTFTAGTDKGDDGGTAAKEVSLTKDGITLNATISADAKGNAGVFGRTDNYRIYKGATLKVSSTVGNITKIAFTCTASGDAQYGPGCFTDPTVGSYTYDDKIGTWTGDAAEVSLTASSNQVRATTIEVTYTQNGAKAVTAPTITGNTPFTESTTVTITAGDGATIYYTTDGTDPTVNSSKYESSFTLSETKTVKAIAYYGSDASSVVSKDFTKVTLTGDGTEANPYIVADILALGTTADEVYIKGKVTADVTGTSYNNAGYYISDDGTSTNRLQVYRGRYIDNADFTTNDLLEAGDVVVIKGKVITYNNAPEVAEGNYIVTLNSGKDGKTVTVDPNAKGQENNPYTVTEAMALTTLAATEVYVKGKVVADVVGSSSNTKVKYYISDDGTSNNQLYVYNGKYLNGEDFSEGKSLKAGDDVVVKGKIEDYKGTREITGSSLVSINGTTYIQNIKIDSDTNAPVYNLSGQRVSDSYKGVVIKNGRKVIQK